MKEEPTEGIDRRVAGRSGLLRRLGRDERGAFAVLFAVLFPVLVGILALGVEASIWWQIKRQNQAVADVAAYSGALEVAAAGNGGSGAGCSSGTGSGVQGACLSAYNDALTNGFDFANSANSNPSLPSLVCAGTLSGSTCTADNTHVTVKLVHEHVPMLASYFGIGTFPIVDVAVANVQSQASCASSVGGSGRGLTMNGGGNSVGLQMPNCTLTSNSTSSDSIDLGGNTTLDAFSIYTAGGIRNVGSSTITLQSPETTGGARLADPYCKSTSNCLSVPASVTGFAAMPTLPSAATTFTNVATTAPTSDNTSYPTAPPTQSQPGSGCFNNSSINSIPHSCYTFSGITITGGTFNSGAYYFTGPVTITGGVTVKGGVDIYVANGDLTVASGGSLTFNANAGKPNGSKADDTVNVPTGNFNASAGTVIFTGDTGAASAYALQVGAGKTASFGAASVGGGQYAFYGGGVTLGASNQTTTLGAADYEFVTGGLSVASGGTARFSVAGGTSASSKTTLVTLGNGGSFSNAGTATFNNAGTSGVLYYLNAPGGYTLSSGSSTTFGGNTGVGLYGGALTENSGANVAIDTGENFYLDSGALALNGCAAVGGTRSGTTAGTSKIIVNGGNLTSASSGSLTFAPTSDCGGTALSGADSTYDIQTTGSNGVSLSGPATFNAATYYFLNSSNSGTGLTLSGADTLAAGIYSIQNGNFSVASGATALFAAGTPCAPTAGYVGGATPASGTCINVANGNISNAGTASFATGNYYLYAPNGSNTSISNTGALTLGTSGSNNFYINNPGGAFVNAGGATINFGEGQYWIWDGTGGNGHNNPGGFASSGALNFTGGCTGGGTGCSNYYFFNAPSFGSGNNSGACSGSSTVYGALSIMAGTGAATSTANFGPGDYYVVNGDLCLDQTSANGGGTAPVLNCTNCAPGGAGVTFILTGSGSDYPSSVSTFQIPGDITTNANSGNGLNAPKGYPDGTTTSTCGRLSHADSGCYAGILFLQDPDYSGGPGTAQTPDVANFNGNSCPNHSNCSYLQGGDNMAFTGAAYMPESVLSFSGNSQSSTCLTLIAESIIFTGNSSLDSTSCAADGVATVTSASIVLTQ